MMSYLILTKSLKLFVDNKAKGCISKRVFQENKVGQIFRKTNISYPLIPHFLFVCLSVCLLVCLFVFFVCREWGLYSCSNSYSVFICIFVYSVISNTAQFTFIYIELICIRDFVHVKTKCVPVF